jgi:hypothetical protein
MRLVFVVAARHDFSAGTDKRPPSTRERLYGAKHHRIRKPQQEHLGRQIRYRVGAVPQDVDFMSGAPQFSGDGARFTAVDPGERMTTPRFTKNGNLQSRQLENRYTVRPEDETTARI